MQELDKKRIADGEAIVTSWFDSEVHKRFLYKITVTGDEGGSVALPRKIVDGTREKVFQLFEDLNGSTKFDDLLTQVL